MSTNREKFTFDFNGKVFYMQDVSWKEKNKNIQLRESWILANQRNINYWNEKLANNKVKIEEISNVKIKIESLSQRNYELIEIIKEFKIVNFDNGCNELIDIPEFKEYMCVSIPNLFEEPTEEILEKVVDKHEEEFKQFLTHKFIEKIGYDSSIELLKEMSKSVGYRISKIPVKVLA